MYDDIYSDSRYILGGFVVYFREIVREGLRSDVFLGFFFRLSNFFVSDDNYFRKECGRDLEFFYFDFRD